MMTYLTYDEADAALCLWEECLRTQFEGHDNVFDWLAGGEGAAAARDMCMEFSTDLDLSYRFARDLGFDDSFDWEFVPRWVKWAMEVTEEHHLNRRWNKYIAWRVTNDWRADAG